MNELHANEHAVVIAGGGPTGLMLAGELALAAIDVVVIEQRPNQELAGTRARGLHARTIEVLDQRGIADRFLSEGDEAQVAAFGWIPLSISDFPTRHPYGLALVQQRVEDILANWVTELEVPLHYGLSVTGFVQDASGVEVNLSNGKTLRTQYLVGCDGGRSVIRKIAGIAFPGFDATTSNLIAEAELTEEPELGLHNDERGIRSISRPEGSEVVEILVTEQRATSSEEPTLKDLSEALTAVYGQDFGVHSPRWISRFTDAARQASNYRSNRVLLAGDAAHIHPPVGGQGLNIGLQDAVNLGWKLAQVAKGTSEESLLDTYNAERHPVGASVIRNTMAQSPLLRSDDRIKALREVMAELLAMEEPRRKFAALQSGLCIHYDFGTGHPLLGRRMPDLDLTINSRSLSIYALLHGGKPLVINFTSENVIDMGTWRDTVQLVNATCDGAWVLPVIGNVEAPSAVLIRPDGYVAWVGDGSDSGLHDALAQWCGSRLAV